MRPLIQFTPELIAKLTEIYPEVGLQETAKRLGLTVGQVRSRASRLGLRANPDSEFARAWRAKVALAVTGRKRPAQSLVMKEMWKNGKMGEWTDERRAQRSAISIAYLKKAGHPRGMLGKHHDDDTKERMSEASLKTASARTVYERAAINKKALKTKYAKGWRAPGRNGVSWKADWREIGGKRIFYRSRWEANYARYLQYRKERGEIREWEHEPDVFWFERIKRGVCSYLPDFKIHLNDGTYEYHEVKGWMDAPSKTKIKRMRIYHPKVRLVVIDTKVYRQLAAMASKMLPGWEHA